jgi:hypothetical protein
MQGKRPEINVSSDRQRLITVGTAVDILGRSFANYEIPEPIEEIQGKYDPANSAEFHPTSQSAFDTLVQKVIEGQSDEI